MSINFGAENTSLRAKLKAYLSDMQWHSWKELREVGGSRLSARLLELKREGYVIDRESIKGSRGFQYKLRSLVPGEPQRKQVKALLPPSDVDVFLKTGRASGELFDAISDAFASYQYNEAKL
jgi:hypothetical protein